MGFRINYVDLMDIWPYLASCRRRKSPLQADSRLLRNTRRESPNSCGHVAHLETCDYDDRVATVIGCVTPMSGSHGRPPLARHSKKTSRLLSQTSLGLLATAVSALEASWKKHRMRLLAW
jgi:hypothetical protein